MDNKNSKEIARTQYCIDQMVSHNLVYTGFTMPDENYGVDDGWLISLKHSAFPLENKTICGGFNFKEDGAFRDYFKEDLPAKMKLECEIPEGTPVYYLNAEAQSGPSKWEKVIASGACLTILAADGIVLFSPKDLKDAFLGYGYDYVPHKTEFGTKGKRQWEKKALIDLSRGFFIPCDTPKDLIMK